MAKVPNSDPNKLEYNSDDMVTMLFGLPFLFVGLIVLGHPYVAEGNLVPDIFALPFGGCFALVGILLVFSGSSKTIDKNTGKITTWWGILGIGLTMEYKISDVQMVTLSCETAGNRHQRHAYYPVTLEGSLPHPIRIDSSRDPFESRSIAEEIGTFLNLPMKDKTSFEEVIREAGTLNQSVRENLSAAGNPINIIAKPPGAECVHTQLGQTHKIQIPAAGIKPGHIMLMGIGAVSAVVPMAFVLPRILSKGATLPPVLFFIVGAAFSLAMFAVALYSALTTTEVEVSPTKMVIVTNFSFYTRVDVLDASKIEELRVDGPIHKDMDGEVLPGSRAIVARSDNKIISFGWWLDEDELKWLLSIVEAALSS